MHTVSRRVALVTAFGALIGPSACVPTTTATVSFSRREFTLGELAKIELVVEGTGFHRVWFEPKNAPRSERSQQEGYLLSWFESDEKGFMVRIARLDGDGSVTLYFSEFNTSFSARARLLYEALISGMEKQFPASVVVDPRVQAG